MDGNSNAEKKLEEAKKINFTPSGKGGSIKKPSRIKKFKQTFFADDLQNVGGNLFSRVIVPGIQRMFTDTIKKAVDWIVYGEKGNPDNKRSSSYVSYSSSYTNEPARQPERRGVLDVYELTFNDSEDAWGVLDTMQELLKKHKYVLVADYYSLYNQTLRPEDPSQRILSIDNEWGWYDLNGVGVCYKGNGYVIDLPRIKQIR